MLDLCDVDHLDAKSVASQLLGGKDGRPPRGKKIAKRTSLYTAIASGLDASEVGRFRDILRTKLPIPMAESLLDCDRPLASFDVERRPRISGCGTTCCVTEGRGECIYSTMSEWSCLASSNSCRRWWWRLRSKMSQQHHAQAWPLIYIRP